MLQDFAFYTWAQFAPAFVLVGIAAALLMVDTFAPRFPKQGLAVISALSAIVTGLFILPGDGGISLTGLAALACIATGAAVLLGVDYHKVTCESVCGAGSQEGTGEFYALPLVAAAGIFCLTQARDIITLFVSLEVLTLSSYVLAGYFRRNRGSVEAGVKYLVLGALSTGLLVFGAAWYFGMTGSFSLSPATLAVGFLSPGCITGILLAYVFLFAGAFFKVGAAPMHGWIPDVYQGAPTPVSIFLGVASKAAGFCVLILLFRPLYAILCEPAVGSLYAGRVFGFFSIIMAATLLIGNLGAIPQSNVKRLLGYSSIGQAGFILLLFLGIQTFEVPESGVGVEFVPLQHNVFYYLTAYGLATVPAFYAVALVRMSRGSEELSAFRGLAKTNPRLAFLITVCFASLAGVPLTAGFIAKFRSFVALLQGGSCSTLCWLLPIAVICAAAGFYYYFKIIREMYWEKPLESDKPVTVPGISMAVLILCVLALIWFGSKPLFCASPAGLWFGF